MPDDLGESLFYSLLGDVLSARPGQAAQEEHRAERVRSRCWLVVPNQEPVQVIESRVLERHGVEPCVVWRPIREGMARAYSAMLGIVESDLHSSPSLR